MPMYTFMQLFLKLGLWSNIDMALQSTADVLTASSKLR
jgi:hypothetical protein